MKDAKVTREKIRADIAKQYRDKLQERDNRILTLERMVTQLNDENKSLKRKLDIALKQNNAMSSVDVRLRSYCDAVLAAIDRG